MKKVDTSKLAALRKAKGKTQTDLGDALLINQGNYSRREKTGDFTEDEIKKLAKALGVKPEEFLSEGEATIDDLYKFLAENSIKQESMMRVILMTVGELLADKKGVPVGTFLEKLTEAVNAQSSQRIQKLQP